MTFSPTCQELIAQLSVFLDGELDDALGAKIEQHLAECAYCHTVANTMQTMLTLYRHAQTAVPPHVHTHLMRMLGIETSVPWFIGIGASPSRLKTTP